MVGTDRTALDQESGRRAWGDYSAQSKELAQAHGPVMASLLGHNLWFGNRAINKGAVDMAKYETTWLAARR